MIMTMSRELSVTLRRAVVIARHALRFGPPYKKMRRITRDDIRKKTRSTHEERVAEQSVRNLQRRGQYYMRLAEHVRRRLRYLRMMVHWRTD